MTVTRDFATALVDAEGRSEFVIVVVADIRGFSRFSTVNESPNIAMFIKRFYLQLINNYFKTASFVKPTGDGLLMTFAYNEKNLTEISATVVEACMKCLNDFPTIFKNDPMINFEIPQSIGFGLARGTACCLYSGDTTLDYSGHLLNLASRLNDLARPSGIVIDGGFLKELIPDTSRELFKEQPVFIRSIAEDVPIKIFYLDKFVNISDSALSPLVGENWETINLQYTAKQFANLNYNYLVNLPKPAESAEKIRVTLSVAKQGIKKTTRRLIAFKDFTYSSDGPQPGVVLDSAKAKLRVGTENTKPIKVRIDYIPKTLPRT